MFGIKKILSTAVFSLILLYFTAAPAWAGVWWQTYRLTNNTVPDSYPQISGNNVVWRDSDGAGNDIFFYNGSTVNQLTDSNNVKRYPQVSGNNVVWYAFDGNDYEIFFYNGSTVTQLTNNGGDDTYPQVSGNNVVWQGHDGNDAEIFLYNGSTVIQLTNNGFHDLLPRVSGDNVIWLGHDGNDYEIFFYNGSTVTQLTNDTISYLNPWVSGNNAVWEGFDGNDNEVFFYNGSTVTQLTNNGYHDNSPKVSGNNVVWEGNDGNDYEIFLYNGSAITQLTNNGSNDESPKISGGNVVWRGHDGNDYEIFFHDGSTVTRLTDNSSDEDDPQISGNNVVWSGLDGSTEIYLAKVVIESVKPVVKMVTPLVSARISKTTTFKVKWSATDPSPSSGIKNYTVKYRPSTSSTWKIWKAGTTATQGYFKGKAGVTYYFRTWAKDNAGNIGGSKVYQTTVPYNEGIFYKKIGFFGYQQSAKSQNYLASVRYSFVKGHTLVYKLYNTNGIGLIVTKGPSMGRARIYVDGKYITTVDSRSSNTRARQLIFYRNLKKKSTHYLKVVNLGTPDRAKFAVDAVSVKR